MINKIKYKINKGGIFRIVFLGDSITSAEWVHPNWREIIEYVLKSELELMDPENWKNAYWKIRFINMGLNGATTRDFLDYSNEVVEYKPDLVIFQTGDNDKGQNISDHEKLNNINYIRSKFGNAGIKIVLTTDTPSLDKARDKEYQDFLANFNKLMPFANELKIDFFEAFKTYDLSNFFTLSYDDKSKEKFNSDYDLIHQGILGNAYIAKIILKKVFEVEFDPEKYVADIRKEAEHPRY